MATVTAKNDFHNTEVKLQVSNNRISKRRAEQLGRELCASDCTCGRTKFFDEKGHQMLADSEPDGSIYLSSVEPTDWLAGA